MTRERLGAIVVGVLIGWLVLGGHYAIVDAADGPAYRINTLTGRAWSLKCGSGEPKLIIGDQVFGGDKPGQETGCRWKPIADTWP